MFKRSLQNLILAICLAFIASIGAIERPVLAQCEKVTDAQIVADIYGQIRADKGLVTQISHINVVSLYAAVKFEGWADTRKDYDKIVGFGLNTNCVRLVNANGFGDASPPDGSPMRSAGGCGSGMKQCGDICIPSGDACSISMNMGLRILFRPRVDGELALVFVRESSCH